MIHPTDPDFGFTDDLTWYTYRLKTIHHESGESREQTWMGYDANHALERASKSGIFMLPVPDEVTATWVTSE